MTLSVPTTESSIAKAAFKGLISFGALILTAVLLSSCGLKTHPYPEIVTLPAPVENLSENLDYEGNLILSWTAPELNMAGRPLKVLDHFDIFEASYPIEDFCSGCPSTYQKVDEVILLPAPPGLPINPGPYYWGKKLVVGRAYRFQVAPVSVRGGIHPEAYSTVTVYALAPPGPLENLFARPDDLSILISFKAPLSGETVQLERRVGEGPFVPLVLTENEYMDLDVAYENTYVYRGRKVIDRDGSLVPGQYSREITVKMEDLLALRPIAFIDASNTPQGVLLYWESLADEPGLKGYRLYRSTGPDDPFQAIGGLIETNRFLDLDPPQGATLRYMVTSVDTSPRANESLSSPVVTIFTEPDPDPGERPNLGNLGY
ncbi:MAG: hypothetical protein LBE38_05525 [Deltaproteobacteria bacterium]|jgi:hypothetical protein|nr:hypothetical protein [Deltaproteobacteria bacterium]